MHNQKKPLACNGPWFEHVSIHLNALTAVQLLHLLLGFDRVRLSRFIKNLYVCFLFCLKVKARHNISINIWSG